MTTTTATVMPFLPVNDEQNEYMTPAQIEDMAKEVHARNREEHLNHMEIELKRARFQLLFSVDNQLSFGLCMIVMQQLQAMGLNVVESSVKRTMELILAALANDSLPEHHFNLVASSMEPNGWMKKPNKEEVEAVAMLVMIHFSHRTNTPIKHKE